MSEPTINQPTPTPHVKMIGVLDVVGVVGTLLLSAGAWMAWHPAGLIVPGAILLSFAVAAALR